MHRMDRQRAQTGYVNIARAGKYAHDNDVCSWDKNGSSSKIYKYSRFLITLETLLQQSEANDMKFPVNEN